MRTGSTVHLPAVHNAGFPKQHALPSLAGQRCRLRAGCRCRLHAHGWQHSGGMSGCAQCLGVGHWHRAPAAGSQFQSACIQRCQHTLFVCQEDYVPCFNSHCCSDCSSPKLAGHLKGCLAQTAAHVDEYCHSPCRCLRFPFLTQVGIVQTSGCLCTGLCGLSLQTTRLNF